MGRKEAGEISAPIGPQMDTLATNFAMALTAKDNIIEEKLKEIEELKQMVETLKREKEDESRDKTQLQTRLDSLNTSADDHHFDHTFTYAEDNTDFDEFTTIRRSRRKRRPKKLMDVSSAPSRVPSAPTGDPTNNGHRKRGRPRVIKTEAIVADGGEQELIDGVLAAADGTTIETDAGGQSAPQKRKFPHHCDWPGCERSFRRPAFLRKHKRVHTGEKPFKCQWEGCAFASADIFCLRTHQMRHTGEKPYKCKVSGCGWSGRQQTSYDRHRRVIHGQQRIFQCDWPGCDRRYRDKHSLNYHRKSHTGEKEFMCSFPECGKRFIGRSDMKKHESTHNAIKPYKCSWPGCGRSFVQKRYLSLHNLKHTGERPFPCDWPGCEWRSFTPHEQAKHKKTHTGERPYPCERCDRRFADESNLKAHLRTVHEGQKNHQCAYPGCGKKYTVRRTLLIHQMKAHPNMGVITGHSLSSAATVSLLEVDDSSPIQTIIVTTDE
ncbi:unnamed protein product [Medioppia subpectinata]|uniref:C2H2-type domain-containing protein n=1 Tax=Medioppia subpectinata TaxID=1979941 RepID=A0A7R9KXX8_9ACAR|nr:unnamed protein product [Medioppia subpectinata]CAG2110621.1 unnamed protein product [Medioppia subpectinata]